MPDVTRRAPPVGRLRLPSRAPSPPAAATPEPVAEHRVPPTAPRGPGVGRINIGRRPPTSPPVQVALPADLDIDIVFGEPDSESEPPVRARVAHVGYPPRRLLHTLDPDVVGPVLPAPTDQDFVGPMPIGRPHPRIDELCHL